MPTVEKILVQVGTNIRFARLRRKHKMSEVAERANVGRNIISLIEKGSPKVSIGKYLNTLLVLGLENDFLTIAHNDEFGRELQDGELNTKMRVYSRKNKW